METYLIGTVVQWVGLIAGLVWIGCGIYQSTEIRGRKKALKNVKALDIILTQIMYDERISRDIREEYIEKAKKIIQQS